MFGKESGSEGPATLAVSGEAKRSGKVDSGKTQHNSGCNCLRGDGQKRCRQFSMPSGARAHLLHEVGKSCGRLHDGADQPLAQALERALRPLSGVAAYRLRHTPRGEGSAQSPQAAKQNGIARSVRRGKGGGSQLAQRLCWTPMEGAFAPAQKKTSV